MRPPIRDEFWKLNISRQRKYQLRMQRDKRCTICGAVAERSSRCLKHLVLQRERQRALKGLKRRYLNTVSYLWEAKQKKQQSSKAGKKPAGQSSAQSQKAHS